MPRQRQYASFIFGALVAQAYGERVLNDETNLQFGLGYVPFGSAFQQREPVLFRRRAGPQLIQASSTTSVGIAHPLWMGFHLYAAKRLQGVSRWGYSLYSFSPTTDQKSLGFGTRVWSTLSENSTLGLSAQSGSMQGGSFTSFGADFDQRYDWGGFTLEYAKNVKSDQTLLAESYYFEPYYSFESRQWVVFLAADYLDNPMNTTPTAANASDPIKKWVLGGGLNWTPLPYVRYRLGVFTHRYQGDTDTSGGQKRNYEAVDLSLGVAF